MPSIDAVAESRRESTNRSQRAGAARREAASPRCASSPSAVPITRGVISPYVRSLDHRCVGLMARASYGCMWSDRRPAVPERVALSTSAPSATLLSACLTFLPCATHLLHPPGTVHSGPLRWRAALLCWARRFSRAVAAGRSSAHGEGDWPAKAGVARQLEKPAVNALIAEWRSGEDARALVLTRLGACLCVFCRGRDVTVARRGRGWTRVSDL